MKAKIVLGLGWGDEGKGITTDFLCAEADITGPTVVVRFSGGQQAGHTVQIGNKRHIYSTFGSGSGRAITTYISEYCTFYPPNAVNEHNELMEKQIPALLKIHPFAKLTCHWDVAYNRMTEKQNNHGSCGIGVGATMSRQEQSPYKLHVIDLQHPRVLEEKLFAIGRYYGEKIKDFNKDQRDYFFAQLRLEEERFVNSVGSAFVKSLSYRTRPLDDLKNYDTIVFEGSQGILLDMEHGGFPHVTYSSTTSKNALQICRDVGLDIVNDVDVYYVTRSYLTRHGIGWFPDSPIKLINNELETNVWSEWQRDFRVGEMDYQLLIYSMAVDESYSRRCSKHLVVTCMDQRPNFAFDYRKFGSKFKSVHESWSPDSKDFRNVL